MHAPIQKLSASITHHPASENALATKRVSLHHLNNLLRAAYNWLQVLDPKHARIVKP